MPIKEIWEINRELTIAFQLLFLLLAMQSRGAQEISCSPKLSAMLSVLNHKLRRLCSKLRWPVRWRSKSKVVIRKFGNSDSKFQAPKEESNTSGSMIRVNGQMGSCKSERPIRIATFNAAMFSMAPAVLKAEKTIVFDYGEEDYMKVKHVVEVDIRAKSVNDRPKSILKQSPLKSNSMSSPEHLSRQQKFPRSKLRVSINLPDNEISLKRSRRFSLDEEGEGSSSKSAIRSQRGKDAMNYESLPSSVTVGRDGESWRNSRTILEVLREVDADILALQDVKAEEEKGMKPLSDLADALGMNYVFAESWAPEYGNAVLSKWPIKRWHVQKICDDTDFRNVLKATVDVPQAGEVNFNCTHLDHLDENWRMKQINAIVQSNDGPHILAGGLNSLDKTDYSTERWTDIVKYYEEIGKPTPKVDVMTFLKGKQYVDAKDFSGECESLVMIAKGQMCRGLASMGHE
uniref:Endonuclease/exonuclease/phosphatase domain-containing protein n=1 Tax=Nelumbo nucifera TaxID=4432 RepID=A0A822Z4E0_NELNU|nr:TPA_asm: hypothetical protein HUJ06_008497 [Nelumbo nucifera]